MTDYTWIDVNCYLPNSTFYGIHSGRKVKFKRANGHEYIDIYKGYGIFGADTGFADVTHWKPHLDHF